MSILFMEFKSTVYLVLLYTIHLDFGRPTRPHLGPTRPPRGVSFKRELQPEASCPELRFKEMRRREERRQFSATTP